MVNKLPVYCLGRFLGCFNNIHLLRIKTTILMLKLQYICLFKFKVNLTLPVMCVLWLQGSSTIFPIVPIGLVIGLQFVIATKTSIYTDQPCLYLLSFGLVSSKITNSLVVSTCLRVCGTKIGLPSFTQKLCSRFPCHYRLLLTKR